MFTFNKWLEVWKLSTQMETIHINKAISCHGFQGCHYAVLPYKIQKMIHFTVQFEYTQKYISSRSKNESNKTSLKRRNEHTQQHVLK